MTTKHSRDMGGNNSYGEDWGGVPEASRTHTDTHFRVEGHKVVAYTKNPNQKKNILNSNSKDAVYLIASFDKDGTVQIDSVNVFEGHKLSYEINLVFDANGNIVPFDKTTSSSHSHRWHQDSADGMLKRKRHDKSNVYSIEHKYDALLSKIEAFNKKRKKHE